MRGQLAASTLREKEKMTFDSLVEGFWDSYPQWILVYGDNTKLVTVIVIL